MSDEDKKKYQEQWQSNKAKFQQFFDSFEKYVAFCEEWDRIRFKIQRLGG